MPTGAHPSTTTAEHDAWARKSLTLTPATAGPFNPLEHNSGVGTAAVDSALGEAGHGGRAMAGKRKRKAPGDKVSHVEHRAVDVSTHRSRRGGRDVRRRTKSPSAAQSLVLGATKKMPTVGRAKHRHKHA
mgnify:CR=1 FL=1